MEDIFNRGDVVEVIGSHTHNDIPFIGMIGTILGDYYGDKDIYAVKFDTSNMIGTHDCDGRDSSNSSRYFRKNHLKLSLNDEEIEKRKIEKKLKKEKYKHVDPFEEEIW